jgi:type IV pilus assembly protein PilX
MTNSKFKIARSHRAVRSRHQQRGAALGVSLILLIVITLVGLAAIGTTIIQNKAAANQYDRQISFQSAEGAMRVAAALIPGNPGMVARDCQIGGTVCQANPFADATLPPGSIHSVPANPGSSGGTDTTFTASAVAAMQPQFVIESMGKWTSTSNNVGCGNSANSRNYGANCGEVQAVYYRVTARSCDPSASACDNRAIVTLQSIIKQG